ncbi:hypothetical protein Tco_0711010 [Tanacetum coccineum]
MKEQLQRIQRPRPQDLNDKSNLIDLMKECHNELTSGEIVSLKNIESNKEVRPERDRVVADLSQAEKDRLRADIRSELTKDDRESQLYDEFEHFGQHKGENIHDYYLYAYLKQHELHVNENKMLMERLNQHSHDPLALVSNVSSYQYPSSSSTPPQPSYIPPVTYQPQFTDNTQLDTGFSPADELLGFRIMSTSTHPIIVLSDSYIEDDFSSMNTPDYTPASLNYFPASSRNTFSDPSKDLSKDLLASLAISPFHDDPYMKVMQAFNATSNESPIPLLRAPIAPPTVLPPSSVLPPSQLFDPQDFFLPEEILPP